MERIETEVVYEEVLDDLLAELRANIMARRDNYGLPTEALKAVKLRLSWVAATEKELEATQQMTLLESGDDAAARASLRWRLRACYLDMAAWIVHARLCDQFLFARTSREIAEDDVRNAQAAAAVLVERAAQPKLFGAEGESHDAN